MKKLSPRQALLAAALVATVAAAVLAPAPPEDGLVAAAKPVAASRVQSSGFTQETDSKNQMVLEIRPRSSMGSTDAFESARWQPPRPVAPAKKPVEVPVVVEAPKAPPLPFRFIGRYDEGGVPAAFLQDNERTIVARVGDQFSTDYQLEVIDDSSLTIIYLPLQERQTLRLAPSN